MTESGLTPAQTIGPFFHDGLMVDGGDHVVPEDDPAAVLLHGRVVDGAGEPVSDAMVEVWQLDPHGRSQRESRHPGFTGTGRVATDDQGAYRVRVLRPPVSTTVAGRAQAPHLDVVVHARGLLRHVMTRAYVLPDDPATAAEQLAGDPVLSALPPERRDLLLARRDDVGLRFDVRLQGEHETPFFDV